MINREFHREHIVDVWNKLKNNIPLEGEERSLGEALGFHRELYPLFESLHAFGSEDIVIGGANPILHITLHSVLENQLAAGDPKEVPEVLENGSAVALALEELGNTAGAGLAYEQLVEYADKSNNKNYVCNALQDYLLFCLNNKGWERKGIETAERLEGLSTTEMEKIQYRLDAAELYANMGNRVKAEQMYQEIVDQNPEAEWALLRWARYLVEIGRTTEAVEYYQRILKLSNKVDRWIISDVKKELAELI